MRNTTIAVIGSYVFGLGILSYASYKTNEEMVVLRTAHSKLEEQLYAFTKDRYIAQVLAKSKYPHTLAAMAKVESDFRPQAKGDNGESKGMYQIQKRHWGEVPDSIEDQTIMAEQILSELIIKYGYRKGIERWNGRGKNARLYRDKVLLAMGEIQ